MLITLARKPLGGGNVVNNCLQFGCGALNVDASRIGTSENLNGGAYAKNGTERHDGADNWRYKREGAAGAFVPPTGRFPANVLLVPTPAVLDGFPVTTSGTGNKNTSNKIEGQSIFKGVGRGKGLGFGGDTGSASRFFKKINKETP